MKILQVNKFWRRQGSGERYIFELSRMLVELGHEVEPFAMSDEDNEPSRYSSLFVSPAELTDPFRLPLWKKISSAARVLYSREARNRISALADLMQPDVAHIHNIHHHLSPSILRPLKERGIGTVMSIHDYKLFCPALRHYNYQGACESCRPFHYASCIEGRCVKSSRTASLLCATEMFLHDLFDLYAGGIDTFIAPSRFVAGKLENRGIAAGRIEVVRDPVDTGFWFPAQPCDTGGYILYCGRLTQEKGVETMVRALAKLPGIPLKVAGSGIMESGIRALVTELGAANVDLLGFRPEEEMLKLMQGCRFVIVPSEGYENSPGAALKAFACAKPVISTRMGGIPELVREGKTGLLVAPGDESGLRQAVQTLWEDPHLAEQMGHKARRLVETEYSMAVHCDAIIRTYKKVKKI